VGLSLIQAAMRSASVPASTWWWCNASS